MANNDQKMPKKCPIMTKKCPIMTEKWPKMIIHSQKNVNKNRYRIYLYEKCLIIELNLKQLIKFNNYYYLRSIILEYLISVSVINCTKYMPLDIKSALYTTS